MNSDEPEKTTVGASLAEALERSAPVGLVPKESLPGWLIEKINDLEAGHDGVVDINFWKGQHYGEDVYFIHNPYNSCIGCEFYSKTGERPRNRENIWTDSDNWVMVYRIVGMGIFSRS
jgi:hypothetical protein